MSKLKVSTKTVNLSSTGYDLSKCTPVNWSSSVSQRGKVVSTGSQIKMEPHRPKATYEKVSN